MRLNPLLILGCALLFPLKQSLAQEKLQVAPNIAWLGKPAPQSLQKLLPANAQILKCGVAAFGPQGAMRWVVAWTIKGKEEKHNIKIGLFSRRKNGFMKSSERSIGEQSIYLPMRLYWLQPSLQSGPAIHLGKEATPRKTIRGEVVTVVVFPQGWKGKVVSQNFKPGSCMPHFWAYEFPFVDNKGFLCLKYILEYAPTNDEGFTKETVLKWNGMGWPEQ